MTELELLDYMIFSAVGLALVVLVAFLLFWKRDGGDVEAPPRPEKAPPEVEKAPPEAGKAPPEVEKAPPKAQEEAPEFRILQEPAEVPVTEVVEAPPTAPPVPPSEEKLRERLEEGLSRSRLTISERLKGLFSRDRLEDSDWEEVEEVLIRADVGVNASLSLVEKLKHQKPSPSELAPALRRRLAEILESPGRSLRLADPGPSVWLVTGVNGVGKTTSIAKLAFLMRSRGREVVLAAADTFRAAAIEQLGEWARRVGVHMVKHAPGADPGAVVFDAVAYAKARGIDLVIVDTAGRIHIKSNLMEELRKIKRIADREATVSESLLVLDATVGQNGLAQAGIFQEAVDVTGVILTKLDGTAKGGIVVAVQEELGIPVKAIGVGESLEDLQPFDPEAFAEALLEAS